MAVPTNLGELKANIEKRHRALTAFNRWEAGHHSDRQSAEQIIAALGTVYALLPPESRRRHDDPNRTGIQAMHQALRHLQ